SEGMRGFIRQEFASVECAARSLYALRRNAFLRVPDFGPEFLPDEGPAEFAVVAFLAIARAEGAEVFRQRRSAVALRDMNAARTVAAVAAHVHELRGAELAAVAARGAEADGVAGDAVRVGVRFHGDEHVEGTPVPGFSPHVRRGGVAWHTRLAPHVTRGVF